MKYDFSFLSNKSTRERLTPGELHDIESYLFEQEDSIIKNIALRLHIEVMRLTHELNDPQYQYSGRIHRHAILCRNADIDRLREELKEKDKLIDEFKVELSHYQTENSQLRLLKTK